MSLGKTASIYWCFRRGQNTWDNHTYFNCKLSMTGHARSTGTTSLGSQGSSITGGARGLILLHCGVWILLQMKAKVCHFPGRSDPSTTGAKCNPENDATAVAYASECKAEGTSKPRLIIAESHAYCLLKFNLLFYFVCYTPLLVFLTEAELAANWLLLNLQDDSYSLCHETEIMFLLPTAKFYYWNECSPLNACFLSLPE